MRLGSRQAGFSLIEVMVSLVVVSLGMLGLAGLLINGMAATKTSQLRNAASLQVSSLADAMSANRRFWGDPELGAISFTAQGSVIESQNSINVGASANCLNTACSAHDLAAYDIRTWLAALNNQLPGARSQVQCSVNFDAMNCNATVKWDEKYYSASQSGPDDSAATGGERQYSQFITP